MIVALCILLYVCIGAGLGGYYSYLRFKDSSYFDSDDALLYVGLFTLLFPIMAPISFAVYIAKKAADGRG